jgi:hypothetical protein
MAWEYVTNIAGPPGDPADITALRAEIGDPHIVAAHTDLVGYIGEIDERLLLLEGSGEPPTATSHLFVDNYSNGLIRVSAGSISASITVDLALATTPGPGGAVYPALGDIPGQAAVWADFNGTLGKMKTSQGADVLGAAVKEWIRKGSILTVHKDTTDAAHPALVVDTIVTPTPAGSNLSLGHLKNVDPTADSAASGKVLGTTAVGQWGAIDPPAGGLSQAQADARYLQLTGGMVQTRHTTIYGHSLLFDINEDEGLMLGTMGPDPDGEFSGIIFTPRIGMGDGSFLQLDSPYPVTLAAPDGTQPNDLVSKGYVDAQVANPNTGHARGDIASLSVPTATVTRITTLTSTAFEGVEVTASNIKLIKAGYWSITVHLSGLLVASGQRSFISFIVNNNVLARMQGGSPGENLATATATIYFTANRLLEFDCYTAGAATTVTGKFYIKYLGAT